MAKRILIGVVPVAIAVAVVLRHGGVAPIPLPITQPATPPPAVAKPVSTIQVVLADKAPATTPATDNPRAQGKALADALADISADPQMSDEVKAAKWKTAMQNLHAVLESGDTDALYHAGFALANPRLGDDPMRGMALALAACNMGRDCTPNNPDSYMHGCRAAGTCPEGDDFVYMLQRNLGQEEYAKLYARAQQIESDIRAKNYDAVLANLTIKQ